MTDEPRHAVSFKDADPMWKAIFAWHKDPHDDSANSAILDSVGRLVIAARLEALEEAAVIAEDRQRGNINGYVVRIANDIAAAIRERAKT